MCERESGTEIQSERGLNIVLLSIFLSCVLNPPLDHCVLTTVCSLAGRGLVKKGQQFAYSGTATVTGLFLCVWKKKPLRVVVSSGNRTYSVVSCSLSQCGVALRSPPQNDDIRGEIFGLNLDQTFSQSQSVTRIVCAFPHFLSVERVRAKRKEKSGGAVVCCSIRFTLLGLNSPLPGGAVCGRTILSIYRSRESESVKSLSEGVHGGYL